MSKINIDLNLTLSDNITTKGSNKMTIKEVAEKFNMTNDTLRYYEKVGLIGPIKKNSSGIRDYSEEDLRRIEFIKCMRSAGISIEVLKKYVDLYDEGENTKLKRQQLLEEEQKKLEEKIKAMTDALEKLKFKIELYKTDKLDKYL